MWQLHLIIAVTAAKLWIGKKAQKGDDTSTKGTNQNQSIQSDEAKLITQTQHSQGKDFNRP